MLLKHILVSDWEEAFDKVDQRKLFTAMHRIGIPPIIVAIIRAIYLYDNPQSKTEQ